MGSNPTPDATYDDFMIKTIFFDFDGVVTMDKAGSVTINRNISEKTGIPAEFIRENWGKFKKELYVDEIDIEEAWQRFSEFVDTDKIKMECVWKVMSKISGKDLDIEILYYALKTIEENKPLLKLIDQLKHRYKIGLITDNGKKRMELLDDFLRKYFEYIIVSADVKSTKKTRKIFEVALDKCGCKAEECLFIDNTPNNLEIPKEMGFATIYYESCTHDLNYLLDKLKELGINISET